ncbi:hypothetical protein U1Q18_032200 [Sarracenia purpurea var. burkii]
MGPREESIDIPISGREETVVPARKEIAAARPPISGNHFAPLYEDTDIQVEKEFEEPDSDLADIENTMADSETEQDQATHVQKSQIFNQSQSKQTNKKSSSSRKTKCSLLYPRLAFAPVFCCISWSLAPRHSLEPLQAGRVFLMLYAPDHDPFLLMIWTALRVAANV